MEFNNDIGILFDIKEFYLRYNHIYLSGAGTYAMHMQEFLQGESLEIDGYIVSNKENTGKNILFDIPIYTLDEIKYSSESCGIILALSEKYHHDMNRALEEYGFSMCFPSLMMTSKR